MMLFESIAEWRTVCRLADNPDTPADILEKLACDTKWSVRARVAQNPNIPAAALEKLANDKEFDVRWAVAHNPNTPPEIQTLLLLQE